MNIKKLNELLFLQFVKCQKCQKKYHLYCTIKKDRDGNITKVKCCEKNLPQELYKPMKQLLQKGSKRNRKRTHAFDSESDSSD